MQSCSGRRCCGLRGLLPEGLRYELGSQVGRPPILLNLHLLGRCHREKRYDVDAHNNEGSDNANGNGEAALKAESLASVGYSVG